MQVTREAFTRYMRVIKRALTDAAAKESARAAEVALATPQEPASAEQTAGEVANDLGCAFQYLAGFLTMAQVRLSNEDLT